MNFYSIPTEGYIPTYTRTAFTDALHDVFGFRTDSEIVSNKQMKNIFRDTKKRKTLLNLIYQKTLKRLIYKAFQSFYLSQLSKMGIYHM